MHKKLIFFYYQLYWSQNLQRTKKELRERENNVTHARHNPIVSA